MQHNYLAISEFDNGFKVKKTFDIAKIVIHNINKNNRHISLDILIDLSFCWVLRFHIWLEKIDILMETKNLD